MHAQRNKSLIYQQKWYYYSKSQWLCFGTASVCAIGRGITYHKLGYSIEYRGLVEDIRSVIVPTMTPESNLSRHRGKCEGLAGMHQSAESIKGSFIGLAPHSWPCTRLCVLVEVVVWRCFTSPITGTSCQSGVSHREETAKVPICFHSVRHPVTTSSVRSPLR